MLAYCKNGVVLATHEESQGIPPISYGAGVVAIPCITFAPVVGEPLPPLGAPDLKAYAATKRRDVVDGGCTVTVQGAPIAVWADAASSGALTALVVAAGINPALTASWKGRDGAFHALNAAAISDLALGVMAFVQEAFETEADAVSGINGASITTLAQIDALNWPE